MDKVATSPTVFGLPRSHWHCTLNNFDWSSWPQKEARVAEVLGGMEAGEAPHILMTGPPGVGKTHLAVGLYRWAAAKRDLRAAHFVHVPSFCDKVKASFDEEGAGDPFARVEDARFLLALDDVFGRELSPWEARNVIPRLIGAAYRNDAALVATMNPTLEEAKDLVEYHEMSRLLQDGQIWRFEGEDRRLG